MKLKSRTIQESFNITVSWKTSRKNLIHGVRMNKSITMRNHINLDKTMFLTKINEILMNAQNLTLSPLERFSYFFEVFRNDKEWLPLNEVRKNLLSLVEKKRPKISFSEIDKCLK